MSIDYYQKNAQQFTAETVNVNLDKILLKFLSLLPNHSHILDAGCGSGRDAKFFIDKGHKVTAIDASSEIVKLATQFTGIPVECLKFEDIDYKDEFDGIWACASLLHIPRDGFNQAFSKVVKSLKRNGILYMSFKYGDTEREVDGRLFNDQNERSLTELIISFPEVTTIEMWKTADQRPEKANEYWINCLAKKHANEQDAGINNNINKQNHFQEKYP